MVYSINLTLNSNEHQYLITTNQLDNLKAYLESPSGKDVTFNFLQTTLTLSGFESGTLSNENNGVQHFLLWEGLVDNINNTEGFT